MVKIEQNADDVTRRAVGRGPCVGEHYTRHETEGEVVKVWLFDYDDGGRPDRVVSREAQ